MNIEKLDKWIWVLVIVPVIALAGYFIDSYAIVGLVVLLPFIVFIKNQFLEDKLAWKPEYSVGVEQMDEDHKKLLDLILQMFKVLQSASDKEKAAAIIAELNNYTITHFTREEELLRQHGYPDLEAHIKEHEVMKQKVKDFQGEFEGNSDKVSSDVLRYLQEWLINHINTTDKKYSEYMANKGVK